VEERRRALIALGDVEQCDPVACADIRAGSNQHPMYSVSFGEVSAASASVDVGGCDASVGLKILDVGHINLMRGMSIVIDKSRRRCMSEPADWAYREHKGAPLKKVPADRTAHAADG
jgi:hypothetical protein